MSDPLFIDDDDANTPLTDEEREQLIPAYITLRHELNEAEQINIGQALRWATARKKRDVLDQNFLRQLHKRMFGDVWRWAGQYRTSARTLVSMPIGSQWMYIKPLTMLVTGSNIKPTLRMKLRCGLVTALLQSIRFPTETDASRVLSAIFSPSSLNRSHSHGGVQIWSMSEKLALAILKPYVPLTITI
jgi:hypothetical protein